jgi:hypothetical protein
MQRKLGLTAVLVVALAVAGYAQKPDFSGTWTPDVDAAAAAPTGGGGGGRGMAGPMTVKQTATELSVERQGRGGTPTTTTYKLDGTETEVAGRGGAMMKVSAKLDGNKLVITSKSEQGENVQTWSLADGKLTIERNTPNGPVKTVYKKTT